MGDRRCRKLLLERFELLDAAEIFTLLVELLSGVLDLHWEVSLATLIELMSN